MILYKLTIVKQVSYCILKHSILVVMSLFTQTKTIHCMYENAILMCYIFLQILASYHLSCFGCDYSSINHQLDPICREKISKFLLLLPVNNLEVTRNIPALTLGKFQLEEEPRGKSGTLGSLCKDVQEQSGTGQECNMVISPHNSRYCCPSAMASGATLNLCLGLVSHLPTTGRTQSSLEYDIIF